MSYEGMTLSQIADKYHKNPKTVRKWIAEFFPELKRPANTYYFTPLQVAEIVRRVGEWPE